MHARHLVATGFVKDFAQAFQKYLGAGKIGDVKQHWAPLGQIVEWIRDSGGNAVLAHPGRYGLTHTRRNALIADFAAIGGTGLELISGRGEPRPARKLRLGLPPPGPAMGADWHEPRTATGLPAGVGILVGASGKPSA